MKIYVCLIACGLFLTSSLIAQEKNDSAATERLSGDSLLAAAQNRASLASEVEDAVESAQKALDKLRLLKDPSGFPVGKDAGLGFAATEIGRRLLAAGKPTAAEVFFEAAESALSEAVVRTSDEEGRDKAQYLKTLAQVRTNYLGKEKEAVADMTAAAALQPDNDRLQRRSRNYEARLKAREGIANRIAGGKAVAQ